MTKSLITDELVAKAARAMRDRPPGTYSDGSFGYYRLSARAALEAVLPEIIEACAKVAERRFPVAEKMTIGPVCAHAAGNHIAIAIRSLARQTEGRE